MKINRRTLVAGLGAAALAAAAGAGALLRPKRPPVAAGKRPHIVLFIADDLRYNALGFAGDKLARTPFLDSVAADAFVFRNHFVTTSTCPTSRASIMTGTYYRRHRAFIGRDMDLRFLPTLFPGRLKRSGYYTGFLGKWGFGAEGAASLFDDWFDVGPNPKHWVDIGGDTLHLTDYLTRRALAFLDEAPKDKPLLMIVSYKGPHGPYDVPNRFEPLFENVTFLREKTDSPAGLSALPPLMQQSGEHREYRQTFAGGEDTYQKMRRNYYSMMAGIDDSIRQIGEALRTKNLWDDTMFLFTSDNGYMFGDHGLIGKSCMYEESIRTPLVVHLPKYLAPDAKDAIERISLNVDIAPTVLAAAGLDAPPETQGDNLLRLMLRDDATPWRRGFFYEMPKSGRNARYCEGFRTDRWKFTRYGDKESLNEMLYDLVRDPDELHDFSGNKRLQRHLKRMQGLTRQEKRRLSS